MSKAETELQELLRELREKVEHVRRLMHERGDALDEEPVRAVVHMRVPMEEAAEPTASEGAEDS
ncbi:MAG: hypothetical protein HRF45_07540 [Fimbriimonadia bacterium]|jgi:hypothetical protein